MRFCIYRDRGAGELRVGAQSTWPGLIIDINRAEVALLASRAVARRAHELAAHLVPADPSEFLAAGASVWQFARDAAAAVVLGATTPHGDDVLIDEDRCVRVEVLPCLARRAEDVTALHEISLIDDPDDTPLIAAIIGRTAQRVSEDDAWTIVAAFVDVTLDPTWIVTADELGDNDAEVYCGVADLVSTCSKRSELRPGDVLCPRVLLAQHERSRAAELILTATG